MILPLLGEHDPSLYLGWDTMQAHGMCFRCMVEVVW